MHSVWTKERPHNEGQDQLDHSYILGGSMLRGSDFQKYLHNSIMLEAHVQLMSCVSES